MKKVFISYAKEDAGDARRLYDALAAAGVAVWLDTKDLAGGCNWRKVIAETIRECTHFAALLSRRSVNKRGYVQKELKMALDVLDEFPDGEVFIIPVRLDDCGPRSQRLRDLHWVDMFPEWSAGIDKILKTLALWEERRQESSSRKMKTSDQTAARLFQEAAGRPPSSRAKSSHSSAGLYLDGARCVRCGNPVDVVASRDGTPQSAVCDMCGMTNFPQHLGQIPTPFAKVMSLMPKLLGEMQSDLSKPGQELWREFFIVKRTWLLNVRDPCFVYYIEDHPNLQGMIHVLENYGFVQDVTPGNTKKYRMTEEFVELVLAS